MNTLYQLQLSLSAKLTEEQATQVSLYFDEIGHSVTLRRTVDENGDDGRWEVLVLGDDENELGRQGMARLAQAYDSLDFKLDGSLSVVEMPAIDWLAHVYQNFKPITVDDFYIYGSHVETHPPAGLIPIEINAANAFGTGEHPTTKGCLQALSYLKHRSGLTPATILDLGCGSAILSIAAAKIWPHSSILATDMDADSVDVAAEYALRNGTGHIVCKTAMGYDCPAIKAQGEYDLILANILAGPLIELAEETARTLKTGGYVVLSGTLIEQQPAVQVAHEKHGLTLIKAFPIEEWTSFIMQKQ